MEPRRPVRTLTRHDTKVTARVKLHDEAGVAIDLTGKTLRYSLRDLASGTLVVNRATAVLETQATNPGEAYYTYTAGQVAHALSGAEEWHLDHGSSVTETFPVGMYAQRVQIVADIDNA